MYENRPNPNNKQNFRPPALGGASLLVIFAVLCLTVFALLSLSTVQADCRLANASIQAIDDYYAADWEAQALLGRLRQGDIDEKVSLESYLIEGQERIAGIYAYTCQISETQDLQVRIRLNQDGSFAVLRWQAVPSGDWQSDNSIELWDGLPF